MQTEHSAVGLPASVLADAVRRRSFSGSVRGFDRNEVREYLAQVAAELEQISLRQEELEANLREARGRASNPVLDEATITAALGQEAARILQSAHEAAADVRRRAEENAANVLREAHESAERIAAESETLLATRTAEAEGVAAGITEAAGAEAEAVVARARAEAEAAVADATARAETMIADADARSRAMVADAERSRDQVLSELMRRRRVVYAQVEQLGAGRDALLAAVASVKTLIGDAEAALESVEADAKTAADAALRRSMNGPQPPVEEVLAEAEAAAPPAEAVQGRRSSRSRRAQPVKAEGPEAPAEEAVAPDADQDAVEEPPAEPVEAEPPVVDSAGPEGVEAETEVVAPAEAEEPPSAPPAASAGTAGRRSPRRAPAVVGEPLPDDAVEGVRIIGPVSAANTPKGDVDQPPTVTAAEPAGTGETAKAGTETERATTAAVGAQTTGDGGVSRTASRRPKKQGGTKAEAGGERPAEAPAPEAAPGPAAGDEAGAEEARAEEADDKAAGPKAAGEPAAVDALFARLRADRVEATKRAEQVLADAPSDAAGEVEQESQAKAGTRRPRKANASDGEAESPGGGSDDGGPGGVAEDGDDAALARRSNLLDPVYDKLTRRLKRTLQDDQNDVLDRMRAGARTAEALLAEGDGHAGRYTGVAAAHLAEAWAAGVAYSADEFDGALTPDPDDGRDAAAKLAEEIVAPLRRRIEEAVATAGSDEASLADAVGAAYRSLKGDRISQLAVDHVTAAFADGVLASVRQGTPVRWVVDDDGPCPDCDDNALAGATPAGEEFPTGQVHPPAHSGCRCLLVAAVS